MKIAGNAAICLLFSSPSPPPKVPSPKLRQKQRGKKTAKEKKKEGKSSGRVSRPHFASRRKEGREDGENGKTDGGKRGKTKKKTLRQHKKQRLLPLFSPSCSDPPGFSSFFLGVLLLGGSRREGRETNWGKEGGGGGSGKQVFSFLPSSLAILFTDLPSSSFPLRFLSAERVSSTRGERIKERGWKCCKGDRRHTQHTHPTGWREPPAKKKYKIDWGVLVVISFLESFVSSD